MKVKKQMKKSSTDKYVYGKEYLIKRTVLRVLAIIMLLTIILPVAVKVYITLGGSIITKDFNNGSLVAERLESELVVDGCFYDGVNRRYVFPGFEFGHGFEETVDQLGIRDWYTEEKLEYGIKSLEQSKNTRRIMLADYVNVKAFGAVYALRYYFTRDLGCDAVILDTNILLKEYKPSGIHQFDNVMSYDEAWDYFNKLYDKFLLEYGEPYEKLSEEATENEGFGSYEPEESITATWISGEGAGQSSLTLQGRVRLLNSVSDNAYMVFYVKIEIDQELDGLSFEE